MVVGATAEAVLGIYLEHDLTEVHGGFTKAQLQQLHITNLPGRTKVCPCFWEGLHYDSISTSTLSRQLGQTTHPLRIPWAEGKAGSTTLRSECGRFGCLRFGLLLRIVMMNTGPQGLDATWDKSICRSTQVKLYNFVPQVIPDW